MAKFRKGCLFLKLFKRNQVIFHEKEVANSLYIIKSGKVLVLKIVDKRVVPIKIARANDFLGESSMMASNILCGVTAIALSDSELVSISKNDIFSYINSAPEWILKVVETLAMRCRNTHQLISDHNIIDKDLANELAFSSEFEVKIKRIIKNYLT